MKLYKDYLETRSHPGEDMLEWFIHGKMTWGMRWLLVIAIVVGWHFFLLKPYRLLYVFYGILGLGGFYLLGLLYYFIKDVIAKQKNLSD